MHYTKSIFFRTKIVLSLIIVTVSIIACRIVYIQTVKGNIWRTYAKQTQLEYRKIPALRGNIYAENGILLATSLPRYILAMDPTVISETVFTENIGPLSRSLSTFFKDHPASYYREKITNARKQGKRYLRLNSNYLNYTEKEKITTWPIFNQGKYKGGLIFEQQYTRYYPFQGLAKRTLGIQTDRYGVGLEHAFHKTLKGTDGGALYQKIVGDNWKMINNSTKKLPIHGFDLETTLDINLQDITHSSLLAVLKKYCADSGCAIVMEVSTGAIKAIVNLSQKSPGSYQELNNYALGHQGLMEPGSTFKIVSMLALLEEKDIPLTKLIDTGNGIHMYNNTPMKDVKSGGYGTISLQEAFTKSSNIGISKVVTEVFGENPEKFIDYIKQVSLHTAHRLDLVGEGEPYIITPKSKAWHNVVTLPWLSIGYNLKVTPLQMLTVYNAIANDGKMVKPFIVSKIKSANHTIKSFRPVVLNKKICSPKTIKKLQFLLEETVQDGTAQILSHSFYKVAGKTGTTKKIKDHRYVPQYITSFIGYFPADNPRYSCCIVVDNPKGSGTRFGAEVAAPVFKDIVDRIAGQDLSTCEPINPCTVATKDHTLPHHTGYFNELSELYRSLDIAMPDKIPTTAICSTKVNTEQKISVYQHPIPKSSTVPNVYNMKLKDALFTLEANGLHVAIQGNIHGRVFRQSIRSHSAIPHDKNIILTLK